MFSLCGLALGFVLASRVLAGFPPEPEGVTIKQVPGIPGVSISYKATTICETKAKGYAGYVHMPSSFLELAADVEPYNISMFFWYFEARHNPRNAQTAIYLAGGPGQSSMYGATQYGGPCTVLQDSNSTSDNPWAWNRYVNMLYVDQPVGAGFSYDTLAKVTYNLLTDETSDPQTTERSAVVIDGTLPPLANTALTAGAAARHLWCFSQAWFSEFPGYQTDDKRVSFWGNSYGGVFVPYSAAYFQEQNVKIQSGELGATVLPIDTVGWTNGCTDMLYQADSFATMANNNTYDVKALPDEVYQSMRDAWPVCKEQIVACRELGDSLDPQYTGRVDEVNQACMTATEMCSVYIVIFPWLSQGRAAFDIAQGEPNPLPPAYLAGYFNQDWVQQALGVPLNFTGNSAVLNTIFTQVTGDFFRAGGLKKMNYLLESGIKAALVYGDRDFRCNWFGGEQLSLAAEWSGTQRFKAAGYQDIKIDDCGNNGGVVRPHGLLSFSRVYQSGHDVAYYQPRTAFEIFTRSMLNLDIATGRNSTMARSANYSSAGPESTWHIRNKLPAPAPIQCNVRTVLSSCTQNQQIALANGTALIKDYIVVDPVS